PPGEFRIYGNQASTLSTNDVIEDLFSLYPNPASTSFQITKPVDNVSVYDITGKLVKAFKGNFPARHELGVSELANGMYLVKIESLEGSTTKRLIIN
ncbi:MAG TPA: T9SS type A sorting domain-containing protein, partial [Flavobacteriaceae bacterium]|nr:T9SS type A sorting domain-containing protein [Flavobacteriaceae bacterium]